MMQLRWLTLAVLVGAAVLLASAGLAVADPCVSWVNGQPVVDPNCIYP